VPTPPADTFLVRDDDRTRLDRFLVRHLPGCSRRAARNAISAGAVSVNGRAGRKGQTLQVGDLVRIDRAVFERQPDAQPDLAVPLLYVDEAMIAVDKPAGMPTVALHADDRDTVANYLYGRYAELRSVGGAMFEAGLVHRLDTATSGVLIAARTQAAWQSLRAQFRAHQVGKLYLAIVAGVVPRRGVVAAPIAQRRRRMSVSASSRPDPAREQARPALTRYRPLRHGRAATLLGVQIPTGVRHQIRAHLAAIGHPVLGDTLYGEAAATMAPRLLLHAARLSVAHPSSGVRIIIRSRLPVDFQKALRRLIGAQR
jgi:23S rRNA pseudouridine1911/1915/1917 synthase